jgi:hypothetical protein
LELVDPRPLGQGGVPSGFGLRVCFGFRSSGFGLSFNASGHWLQGLMQPWGAPKSEDK